jgi:subtilase family serine protease
MFSKAGAAAMQSQVNLQPCFASARVARALLAVLVCLVSAPHGRAAGRQVLHGSSPAVLSQLAPVGRLPESRRLNLAIALPLRNEAALNDLLRQLYEPSSPRYRQYLTPAQFTAEFGPAEQDYEAVAAFAKAHHLTVSRRYSNRLVLDVSGAVSDIENTFHVTMRTYRHPTEARNFYAPDREPSLDLGVPVSHITGLNDYALPQPCFRKMPLVAGARPNTGSGPSGTYMGYDFRSAYAPGVTLTGSGQIVGLLEFDGYTASDITYYESAAGLPNVPLTNVLLDGFNGTPSSSDGPVEVSLDIEMDVSMAPGVSGIRVYEAGPSGNFDDMLEQMVIDNLAKQISSSWSISGQGDNTTADNYFKEMATQGQSFFQASGDSDAYTSSIPFPCDNPYITEVGGTTLTDNGTGGSWSSETAWNWGYDSSAKEYVGSSGGISPTYSIPSWQTGISMTANKGSTTKRNVPDVALTANNVYVEEGGGAYSVGGTSCAAPLWAAFTALVNQQAVAAGKSTVGFVNQAIYTIGAGSSYTTDFHDITTGNNYSSSSPSKFPAVSGYDLCTGWGTPAGTPLINALAPIPASLDVSPTVTFASTGPVGGPFTPSTNSYTLTNPGTSTLAWTASANQTWLSLSATSGTLAANGSATVTASINAGADTLASGTYSGVVLFTYVTTGTVQTAPVTLTVVPAPVITSATSATATAGQPFTYQIAATNSPVSYAASGLPSNLSVDSATGVISGTASLSATGTSNVTISAINLGGTGSATLSLLVQTPYAAWQSTMFTAAELADPAISGDTADPAGDGISNLMKYALNIEPWTSGVAGLPAGSIVTTSSGSYLTITYTQVISAIDLTYTVQVSPDLNTWYSGTGYTNPPFATANADGVTETVTVQSAVPMTSGTSGQFIRLQVTGP